MKKFLQGIIIFLMVLVVAFFGLKDTIIKKVLEKELTNSLGTPVRIYGVDYSVFKELLELKGIGIESRENDAYDIVHIGNINTKLNYKELFNKKVRLDSVDIINIELNKKTERKNKKQPLLNARQEIVVSNKKISDEDVKNIASLIVNSYESLMKVPQEDVERFNTAKGIFLATTTPLVDKYVDYKIESVAEEYILNIISEYRALSNNVQLAMKEASSMDWSLEIGNVNLSTNLFGREFHGIISEISTDKAKMNRDVVFVLDSLSGGETGRISGAINPYLMQGKIDTVINNADISEVKEIADYTRGLAFLNQKIVLNGEEISIDGKVEIKSIVLNKESIAQKLLNDKEAIEKISGNVSDRIGDMEVSYRYNPVTRKIYVDSNIAEEIGIYMGADNSQLKKLEREFKEKYGDEIKKGKEELKAKLEGFLNSFK